MKRFRVVREKDISGISGVGYVAEGCKFRNGKCTVVWRSSHSSVNTYDSIEDVIFVHGHGGATRIEWIDPVDDPENYIGALNDREKTSSE